ncbi:hypothetical protein, partial [Pseudomonas viridiflava]|uniref:hypothetical protein n=1 Tax=Pseudomonas viridiflava TaxID=33069 RepID=UPI003C12FF6C
MPILPSDVLKDFWAQDFAADCKRKADAFWRDHGQDFCTFARIACCLRRALRSAGSSCRPMTSKSCSWLSTAAATSLMHGRRCSRTRHSPQASPFR